AATYLRTRGILARRARVARAVQAAVGAPAGHRRRHAREGHAARARVLLAIPREEDARLLRVDGGVSAATSRPAWPSYRGARRDRIGRRGCRVRCTWRRPGARR